MGVRDFNSKIDVSRFTSKHPIQEIAGITRFHHQLGFCHLCRFANYLANFCSNYMAHSYVWTNSPPSRRHRVSLLCNVLSCSDHTWRESDHCGG